VFLPARQSTLDRAPGHALSDHRESRDSLAAGEMMKHTAAIAFRSSAAIRRQRFFLERQVLRRDDISCQRFRERFSRPQPTT